MAAKSALAKDPSTPETTKRGNWRYNNRWVNKEGYLVDNYGKVLPNQKNPFVPAKKNPFGTKKGADEKDKKPTPQERIEKGLPELVAGGIEKATQFDPMEFYKKYQPAFEEGRQREYERLYGQFERQNAEQFAREKQQQEQSLVERGLDPSGEAYKSLQENLYKSQEAARQNARDAAMTQANALQQQYWQQASGGALLPSQIAQPYLNIYSEEAQRKWTEEQARLQRESQEKIAGRAGGGGGGGSSAAERAWIDYIMRQYPSGGQPQGQSTTNAAIQGTAQGIGTAITAGILR